MGIWDWAKYIAPEGQTVYSPGKTGQPKRLSAEGTTLRLARGYN